MAVSYKVLFLSPRNTVPQNLSLLKQTSCEKFFFAEELSSSLRPLLQAARREGIRAEIAIAAFDDWVASYTVPFPVTKSYDEAKDDPIMVLHSSGSTGNPKPVTSTHAFFAATDRPLPVGGKRTPGGISLLDWEDGGFIYSPFPAYHMAGITALSYFPIFTTSAAVILGPADRPPTLEVVQAILQSRYVRVLYLPSSIIEALAQNPSTLQLMKKCESVIFAGGPLSRPIGDMIAEHVKLSASYGSTEMANVACLLPEERIDWSWLCWHPAHRVIMEPADNDTYELALNRDLEADPYRAISQTILRRQGQYRSPDLFKRHPTKPDLWQFHGCSDDIIVFSNGEKWNPVPPESIILGHPKLTGVLISGDGRFEASALLEPKQIPESDVALIDELWPVVQHANEQSQSFGRISRTKLAIVPPASLIRAPKGTVVRSLSAEKFCDVIESLYTDKVDANSASFSASALDPKSGRQEDFPDALHKLVKDCVKESLVDIGDDDDFYVSGMDSLQTLELTRTLKRALSPGYSTKELEFLSTRLVFTHPSIEKPAGAVYHSLRGEEFLPATENIHKLVDRLNAPIPTKTFESSARSGLHVLVTGSSGFLGRSLLIALCLQGSVSRIFCLKREASASFNDMDFLSKIPLQNKLIIETLTASLDQPAFGLAWENLRLIQDVDIIVHAAWKVDFNQTLIFRALTSAHSRGAIPEDIIHDTSAADATGYGQSKQAAERALARLVSQTNQPITILRIGQIAGSIPDTPASPPWTAFFSPSWSPDEWVPLLVRTSRALRLIPADLPVPVDWLPATTVAESIVQIALKEPPQGVSSPNVINIINPRPRSWASLVPTIKTALGEPQCRVVAYADWLEALHQVRRDVDAGDEVQVTGRYPALKILEFFERLGGRDEVGRFPGVRVEKARMLSAAIDGVGEVQDRWMEGWVREWV
ncbi:MAG: hypothetical protein Q9160_005420 [Pyrenula sp. 1 TL-2023]